MLRTRFRQAVGVVGPFLITLTLAANASASPAEGGHDSGISLFNWPSDADPRIGLVWLLINFAVLLFLINRLIWRNLVASNHVRHDTIKSELEQATSARMTAESVVREFKAKIENFDKERQSLIDAAKAGAASDREKVIAEAEAEAAKIVATATATAEREAEHRRTEVESEIVGKAIERARALLVTSFNDADQRRLVETYATDVATSSYTSSSKGEA